MDRATRLGALDWLAVRCREVRRAVVRLPHAKVSDGAV